MSRTRIRNRSFPKKFERLRESIRKNKIEKTKRKTEEISSRNQNYLDEIELASKLSTRVFLDTNIFDPQRTNEEGNRLSKWIIHGSVMYSGQIKNSIRYSAENFSLGMKKILERNNIYVTSGVLSEIEKWKERLADELKKIGVNSNRIDKELSPLDEIIFGARVGYARTEEEGLEEDPLVKRIYELLPSRFQLYTSPYSENDISKTDRELIAIAFATGANNGGNETILTMDRGVHFSLTYLQQLIQREPDIIKLDDLAPAGRFNEFKVKAMGIYPVKVKKESYSLKTKAHLFQQAR